MAKFSINLLVPYMDSIIEEPENVTGESNNTANKSVQYYRELITDFELNNNVYNYTFDEQITINKNAQEELSFKMFKNIRDNDITINNPFFTKIKNGTLIEVIDKYKFSHWFVINKIDYKIKKHNVEINYGATDYFNNQLSKRETSYTINNDPSTTGFIGAKNLQYWIDKICNECKISYSYIPLEYEIYATNEGQYIAKLDNNYYNLDNLQIPIANMKVSDLRQLMRKNLADIDRPITYSLSGSSAANAIINLGEQYGLSISVDYRTKTFWYKEIKNSTYTGLKYSPNIDLQSLSVGQQTNNLTTIFNIKGPEIAGEQISLFSNITPLFIDYFLSGENVWDKTIYYPNMYTDYLETQKKNNNYTPTVEDYNFAKQADLIPYLESKIFKSSYIKKVYKPYLYKKIENTLFNDLRIVNGKILAYRQSYYSALQNKVSLISEASVFNDKNGSLILNATINNSEVGTKDTLQNFYNSCKSSTAAAEYIKNNFNVPLNKVSVLDKDETITYYGKLYRNALQRFLKNIYYFRKYYTEYKNSVYYEKNNSFSNAQKYQLSIYWEAAYNASLSCDYAIPKDWQRTDCWKIIDGNGNIINDIVPEVLILEEPQLCKQYYYDSNKTLTGEPENWMKTFHANTFYKDGEKNIDIYNCNHWQIIEDTQQKEDIYKYKSGGLTWATLISNCCNLPENKTYLNQGWYQNFIKQYLSSISVRDNSILTEYNSCIEQNKNIWKILFKEYGMLLLESSFTSETATTPEELYNEAMTYYAEYENPEKTYNLTITDISFIEKYIPIIITVGDQIALDYNEFYQEEDDLKDLLQEHLFISSIHYNLRKDSDIQYNVVTTSFYDKLFNKLASLIK